MLTKQALTVLALSLWSISLVSTPVEHRNLRCGGDGPKPFADISGDFDSRIRHYKTDRPVSEFSYLEYHNALAYRAPNSEVRIAGDHGDVLVAHSNLPLSGLADPRERFLLTEQFGFALDLNQNQWRRFNDRPLEHLTWDSRNHLISVAPRTGFLNRKFYDFMEYDATSNVSRVLCSEPQDGYRFARGHEYPFVFMYRVEPRNGRNFLAIARYDLRSCKVASIVNYNDGFNGEIQQVVRFEKLNATAVKVNHSSENLFWESGGECRYFDIENKTAIIPDTSRPYLFTAGDRKLNLYFLNSQKKTELIRDFGLEIIDVSPRDLYLIKSGQKVYFSPKVRGGGDKQIYTVDLDRPQ